jgi:hypothetical protein
LVLLLLQSLTYASVDFVPQLAELSSHFSGAFVQTVYCSLVPKHAQKPTGINHKTGFVPMTI